MISVSPVLMEITLYLLAMMKRQLRLARLAAAKVQKNKPGAKHV